MINPDLTTLLSTTPENLAHVQHERLHAAAVVRLEHVLKLLKARKYEDIENHLGWVTDDGGDDYGYISFDYLGVDDISNLGNVIERLKRLKQMAEINQ